MGTPKPAEKPSPKGFCILRSVRIFSFKILYDVINKEVEFIFGSIIELLNILQALKIFFIKRNVDTTAIATVPRTKTGENSFDVNAPTRPHLTFYSSLIFT